MFENKYATHFILNYVRNTNIYVMYIYCALYWGFPEILKKSK